ncbi:WRKY DNA-binding transcription factor 70-like [Miscanthus floridulus]|uniref:WRKY DNA-binding transcription factor 70-like n=1 Tax=Miscanthus floridulus TaxID=154761 RepID=UPI003459B47D
MQTQSRLAVNGGGSSASEDEHEAVIRELTRGHELTAQLRAEALRALRGQGQAEATAAFILQEVSRAFTVCLSIMSSPARAPPSSQPPPTMEMAPAPALAPPRRSRGDSIPREQRTTSSPHSDGHQWRKYGQKRITKTQFPRCYFKCSFHRERNCRATKQVQQCSNDDPPQYVVMYFNDHTCDTAATSGMMPLDDLSGLVMARQQAAAGQAGARALLDGRGVQEEHERRLFVSSLACVLGGHQQQSPAGSGTTAAVNVGHQQEPPPRARTRDDAPAGVDAPGEMPRIIDVDVAGLDVMDYDVTDALCFGDSYDLPGDGFPF